MMSAPDPARAAELHEDLMRWLAREHPQAAVLDVLGALTYEIGRIAGQLTTDQPDAVLDRTLDGIRQTLHTHVLAYRRGLRH